MYYIFSQGRSHVDQTRPLSDVWYRLDDRMIVGGPWHPLGGGGGAGGGVEKLRLKLLPIVC